MPDTNAAVLLATEAPIFSDGGDFLLCELVSGGRKWAFGIPWGATALAMQRCGTVLEAHQARARNNVAPFVHKAAKERPPRHHR